VPGHTHTNLVFDVVVPFGFPLSDEEVRSKISERVLALEKNCYAVVQVDKASVTKE